MGNKFTKQDIAERFLAKFEQNKIGCWLWKGEPSPQGYGQFYVLAKKGKEKIVGAHRFSYEYFIGKIPKNLQLDHLCRNQMCVNPKHLEPVTTKVNSLRGIGLGAKNKAKTKCDHGHPLSGTNLSLIKGRNGQPERRCNECVRTRSREYQQERRQRLSNKSSLLGV